MDQNNIEMYQAREKEILEELGKMKMDDSKRKPLVDELTAISKILVSYEQTELTRLNNNAQNDINEARLIIDEQKVKNDKEKNQVMAAQGVLSLLFGGFCWWKSYHMDEDGFAFRGLKDWALKQIDRVKGK